MALFTAYVFVKPGEIVFSGLPVTPTNVELVINGQPHEHESPVPCSPVSTSAIHIQRQSLTQKHHSTAPIHLVPSYSVYVALIQLSLPPPSSWNIFSHMPSYICSSFYFLHLHSESRGPYRQLQNEAFPLSLVPYINTIKTYAATQPIDDRHWRRFLDASRRSDLPEEFSTDPLSLSLRTLFGTDSFSTSLRASFQPAVHNRHPSSPLSPTSGRSFKWWKICCRPRTGWRVRV